MNRKGFTLVEVIVILAVIAILAAIAVPMALRLFQVTAEDATREEMQNLKKALIGDPAKLQSSVRSDFGFLGDIGCLPSTTLGGLDRLLDNTGGKYPGWSFDGTKQIGAGWNGPYITGAATGQEADEFKKDQWGNSYTYTPAASACPLTATFTSSGPNGIFDGPPSAGDDIDFSVAASDTTATVSGFIKDKDGNPVPGSSVTINYPVNGTWPPSSPATTDSAGRFSVSNIPFGKRSINVSPKLIQTSSRSLTSTDTALCGTGVTSCTLIEFNIVNFSTAPVSVTSLTASYTVAPAAFYYRIIWGATTVFDCTAPPGPACGTGTGVTRTLASQTIGAASTAISPFVFVVDQAQGEIGDIRIGRGGEVGTAVRIQIVNFRNCSTSRTCGGATAQVSMAGVAFTVTFSDGSVIKFTPVLGP